MRVPSGEYEGAVSMTCVSVKRVVAFERKSITNRLELPPRCKLKITRWPSGEKRGLKVMPGKLLTISRCPVSMFDRPRAVIPVAARHQHPTLPNVKTACSRPGIVPFTRQPSHGEGHM